MIFASNELSFGNGCCCAGGAGMPAVAGAPGVSLRTRALLELLLLGRFCSLIFESSGYGLRIDSSTGGSGGGGSGAGAGARPGGGRGARYIGRGAQLAATPIDNNSATPAKILPALKFPGSSIYFITRISNLATPPGAVDMCCAVHRL